MFSPLMTCETQLLYFRWYTLLADEFDIQGICDKFKPMCTLSDHVDGFFSIAAPPSSWLTTWLLAVKKAFLPNSKL